MVQNWIAQGKPIGTRIKGSYESYSQVMGGILEAAEIIGFLTNADRVYAEAD